MPTIIITRTDPIAGIPDSHEPGVLSQTQHPDWPSAFGELRRRQVPITEAHEAQIMQHPDTQFVRNEFVNFGHSACMVRVHYDIQIS